MQKTDLNPSLSETDALSRRSFLAAGALLLGATLPTAFTNAQEQQPEQRLNAAARLALLSDMERIVDQGGEAEARASQIPQVAKLVEQYREALKGAPDLTVEELSRATRVVQLKINMPHYSGGINREDAEKFINISGLEFYRDLHTRLTDLKKSQPDKASEIESSLNTIQGDIYWSAWHAIPGISRECGELVSDLYIKPENCTCITQIERQMHFNHSQHAFYLALLSRCQECLPRIVSATIGNITSGTEEHPQSKAESLLRFATHARDTIAGARKCELLPESEAIILSERFSRDYERPLFDTLVPIFAATVRNNKNDPISGATRFIDFGVLIPPIPMPVSHPPTLPMLMGKFINGLEGSRVELGNQFMKSYQSEVEKPEFNRARRLELVPLLAYLAPEPSLKESFTSDLRALLQKDRTAINDPKTLSAYLGVLLVSDHLYGASEENKSLNISSAGRLSCSLMNQKNDTSRLVPAITPAEALLVDLTRTIDNPQAVDALVRSTEVTEEQRYALSDLADRTVLQLAFDIYKLAPSEIYQNNPDHYPEVVSIPEHWGSEGVIFGHPERGAEFLASLQALTRLADGITASYARFQLTPKDERALVDRLILVSRLLEERETVRGIAGENVSDPIGQVRNSFPYLSDRSLTGPFSQVLQKSRNMLYQARHGRMAPVIPQEEDPRINRLRDDKLEVLARDYAKAAEEHFVCSYVIQLWHSDEDRSHRPLESHHSLSSARMAREVALQMNDFGFSQNHDGLRALLEKLPSAKDGKSDAADGPGRNGNLLEEVRRYRDTVAEKRDRLMTRISAIVNEP